LVESLIIDLINQNNLECKNTEEYGGIWRNTEEYGGIWRNTEEYEEE